MTYPPKLALRVACAAALLLALVPWAGRVYAATFTVTTTTDAPHALPLDGSCTSTLRDKACTLRAAVQAANFLGGPQTINLQVAGTYTLTVAGPNEDDAATGDLDIKAKKVVIANTSGGTIVISGPGGPANDRLFEVLGSQLLGPSELVMSDVTLAHGEGTPTGGGIRVKAENSLRLSKAMLANNTATAGGCCGGGIANSGTATLTDVTFSTNAGTGGGIFNEGPRLTLNHVQFSKNTAATQGGGLNNVGSAVLTDVAFTDNSAGINGGGLYNAGNAKLNNVTFSGNSAGTRESGVGGGIHNPGGSLAYSQGSLTSNTANEGAAIYNNAKLSVTDVTVSGNSATNLGGGLLNNATAHLSDVTISGNSANGSGGIANSATASLVLSRSTLTDNAAVISAGGLSSLGNAQLNNVTLSGNTALGAGGGILISSSIAGGATKMTNVTISNNSASIGGGIRIAGGAIALRNTLLANAPAGVNCSVDSVAGGTLGSAGSNLSNDNSCAAFFTAVGDLNNTDPLLGPLQITPPGTTATHALLPGSPAIDAVLNPCPPPATDQRGVIRPQGPKCDIGAFEVGLAAVPRR
jgi:predicted outer membrane repeat protein